MGRPWSSSTVPSAWTSTLPSPQDTTTLTGLISGPDSLTCCSWSTPSTGLKGQQISLCHVYTGSRFTLWPTRFSSRQQLTLRLMRPNQAVVRKLQKEEQFSEEKWEF